MTLFPDNPAAADAPAPSNAPSAKLPDGRHRRGHGRSRRRRVKRLLPILAIGIMTTATLALAVWALIDQSGLTSESTSRRSSASETEITGTARLEKEAQPIPYLKVVLLRTTARRDAVAASLRSERDQWLKAAARLTAQAEDYKDDPDFARAAITQAEQAQAANAKVTQIDSTIATLPERPDVMAAFRWAREMSRSGDPHFEQVVDDAKASEPAMAGADGVFKLYNVPPGSYLLHAEYGTENTLVEWLIPVQAAGGVIRVELTKDNAGVMKGYK